MNHIFWLQLAKFCMMLKLSSLRCDPFTFWRLYSCAISLEKVWASIHVLEYTETWKLSTNFFARCVGSFIGPKLSNDNFYTRSKWYWNFIRYELVWILHHCGQTKDWHLSLIGTTYFLALLSKGKSKKQKGLRCVDGLYLVQNSHRSRGL